MVRRNRRNLPTSIIFVASSEVPGNAATTTSDGRNSSHSMSTKRSNGEDEYQSKRQKTNGASLDPKANPYLAHMYDDEANGYSNGYSPRPGRQSAPLSNITRHESTAKQAKEAEDGPVNAFTGQQLSERYYKILNTRRNLPVHSQR